MLQRKILITGLMIILSLSVQQGSAVAEQKQVKFAPANEREVQTKQWLKKTLKEFPTQDQKNFQRHFYLFDILQDALSRLSLERRQALLHSQDKDGWNFFHRAVVRYGDQDRIIMLLRILIFSGVDINRKNFNGDTAFHLAYKINARRIIAFLRAQGINRRICNNRSEVAARQAPCKQEYEEKVFLILRSCTCGYGLHPFDELTRRRSAQGRFEFDVFFAFKSLNSI